MIKVQNNIATREPVPNFLVGLMQESLLDLSWTDPALGVQDCVWWPEEDQSASLGEFEVYGSETLTLDDNRKVVVVTHTVEPMPQEQIDAISAAKASAVRSERNALLSNSDWTQVADAPVNITLWATYRQALRDITSNINFPYLTDADWPTEPQG